MGTACGLLRTPSKMPRPRIATPFECPARGGRRVRFPEGPRGKRYPVRSAETPARAGRASRGQRLREAGARLGVLLRCRPAGARCVCSGICLCVCGHGWRCGSRNPNSLCQVAPFRMAQSRAHTVASSSDTHKQMPLQTQPATAGRHLSRTPRRAPASRSRCPLEAHPARAGVSRPLAEPHLASTSRRTLKGCRDPWPRHLGGLPQQPKGGPQT